jgi:hypothetical protein
MIEKLNYIDMTPGRSANILREIQQFRLDMKEATDATLKAQGPQKNLDSPYASDRAGRTNIYKSWSESDWKRTLDII